jgi:hypothetical protein
VRSRRDSTQRQIVQALRQIGCSVVDLSQAAGAAAWLDEHGAPQRGGLPDLLAAGIDRRTGAPVTVLLEVKTEKGRLRTQQQQFAANWRGPVYTVRSADEALMCFGIGANP